MTPAAPPIAVPLWLDLLAVRAELAATGFLAVPYARRHGIDLAAIEVCAGIPVLAALRYGADRSWDPGGRTPSMVIEARGEDGVEVVDLVAWPLGNPTKVARLYGRAAVLNVAALAAPSPTAGPLHVHRTPLRWLQAAGDGVVLLDPARGILPLRDVGGAIAAEDEAHAAELAGLMVASLPLTRIVVPEARGGA